jgi:hypothetical protein
MTRGRYRRKFPMKTFQGLKRFWLAGLFGFFVAGPASAASLNLLGGLNFQDSGGSTSKGEASYGGTLEFNLSWRTGFEVGVFSLGEPGSVHETLAPAMLRFRLFRYVDLGLGGYYATSSGVTDYGARAGFRISLPIAMRVHFLIDGSYNYGLKDLDPTAGVYKNREYSAMAGLSFWL